MVPEDGLEPSLPKETDFESVVYTNFTTRAYILREWRRVPESNRGPRICNPLHSHSANAPFCFLY